ncbi:uncharacterized protein LOC107647304 [Arachis ipaensis]|uniref:uncharacterized protein LOC107647304 n=1 Tax=Arachis ipaensis TaxID=130454 RepID=UPI0007AF947A|nr:uncharacterized protein LOC107647304 [Arachis ipaensis]
MGTKSSLAAGHYLLVQRWRPLFNPCANDFQRIAVWVWIPDLPVELYTQPFLWKVRGKIGSMLKIDQTTSIHSREKFARLCVEIDLWRKLVPAIEVLGREFRIEYESLHFICFGCGRYGHKRKECPDGGVTNAKMHSQAATTETIPMVKANGEGLDAPNLALDNSKVVPKERGIVTEVQAKSMERVDENVGNQTTSFGPWMLVSKNQRRGVRPK